ncbi:hypothetical protein AXK11_00140 [Cephaloticoccus primus]|uniref:Uncharacterized protein n=1 Tax=Cephaloticoccus primus TaxID=1548207 RepID=A0A139SSY6_9BACT|nr:hypothetical protein [Cephaloticoccus primus]KXU37683.1 hypothetical protein AXK11_00140 [Cephaloticoccus primus]
MTSTGKLLADLDNLLIAEEGSVLRARQTRAFRKIVGERKKILVLLREARDSRNIDLIIAAEKMLIEGDLLRYTNSREMRASLTSAFHEMVAIELHLELLKEPEKYRFVDRLHGTPKTREGDYPLDTARLALNSHVARLKNLDRSRLDETEKELIELRKEYMIFARDLYIARQAETLVGAEKPAGM